IAVDRLALGTAVLHLHRQPKDTASQWGGRQCDGTVNRLLLADERRRDKSRFVPQWLEGSAPREGKRPQTFASERFQFTRCDGHFANHSLLPALKQAAIDADR